MPSRRATGRHSKAISAGGPTEARVLRSTCRRLTLLGPGNGYAAIDEQRDARDEARCIRREVKHRLCDLLGLCQALQSMEIFDESARPFRGSRKIGVIRGRVGATRKDSVHTNALRAELGGKYLRQTD